jgi:hypothetical protein
MSGQSLIVEAITDYLGERCPEYAEGCFCCEAWAEFDRLTANTNSGTANEVRSGRCSSPDAGTLAGFVSTPAGSVSEEISATNSVCQGGNGPLAPVLSATEKQRACGNGPDQSSSQVPSSQPAEPAGEVFLLQTSPATPLNPRPMISRGSSLTDAQAASAGDTAASLSYSDGDA